MVRVDTNQHPQISRIFLGSDIIKVIQMQEQEPTQKEWFGFGMDQIWAASHELDHLVELYGLATEKDETKIRESINKIVENLTDVLTCIDYDALKQ